MKLRGGSTKPRGGTGKKYRGSIASTVTARATPEIYEPVKTHFFRRIPELVEAWQYTPAEAVVVVPKRSRKYKPPPPRWACIETCIGVVQLTPGDWVVRHADGSRQVWPDSMFRLAFEAV